MDKQARRIQVMLQWRESAAARGHAVPSPGDMTKIGAAGEVWPGSVDTAAVGPWSDTISYLLKQLKFGVVDPVQQLPAELLAPRPAPPGPARSAPTRSTPARTAPAAPAGEDPRLTALKRWRQESMGTEPALAGLKDAQLNNIVRAGSRTIAEIGAHLPASLTRFAREMATVLAGVAPGGAPEPAAEVTGEERPGRRARSASGAPAAPHNSWWTQPSAPAPAAPSPAASSSAASSSAASSPAAPGPVVMPTVRPPSSTGSGSRPSPPAPGDLGNLRFVRYNYLAGGHPEVALRMYPAESGGTRIEWPAHDGEPARGVVVYRVVSHDDADPASPDDADEITVTTGLSCTDDRPFRSPVRRVQVWCHAGTSLEAAAGAQPVRHASATVVAPVQNASIAADEGKVVGEWSVLAGAAGGARVARVRVYRIPLENAEPVIRRGSPDMQYEILPADRNLTGFVDGDAVPGRRYVYQAWAEAELAGGNPLSAPYTQGVDIPVVLAPVRDLAVDLPGSELAEFTLSWSPPGCEVAVYRTEQAPAADAAAAEMPVSALGRAGLPDGSRLKWPVAELDDGRVAMRRVPWPAEWTRAYFTPVTIQGGRARIGPSVRTTRMRPMGEARVVERTSRQVVTFAWPAGAASVLAYVTAPGDALDPNRSTAVAEISRQQYERQGGLHLTHALPYAGCALHLVPVAYAGGERVQGAPASVEYPGLLRLAYRVERQRSTVVIRILSEYDLPHYSLPFVLVHRPDRLPLEIRDGTPLPTTAYGAGAQGGHQLVPPRLLRNPGDVAWSVDVSGLSGYLRLFIDFGDQPPRTAIALLDPAVSTLRLGHGPGR